MKSFVQFLYEEQNLDEIENMIVHHIKTTRSTSDILSKLLVNDKLCFSIEKALPEGFGGVFTQSEKNGRTLDDDELIIGTYESDIYDINLYFTCLYRDGYFIDDDFDINNLNEIVRSKVQDRLNIINNYVSLKFRCDDVTMNFSKEIDSLLEQSVFPIVDSSKGFGIIHNYFRKIFRKFTIMKMFFFEVSSGSIDEPLIIFSDRDTFKLSIQEVQQFISYMNEKGLSVFYAPTANKTDYPNDYDILLDV